MAHARTAAVLAISAGRSAMDQQRRDGEIRRERCGLRNLIAPVAAEPPAQRSARLRRTRQLPRQACHPRSSGCAPRNSGAPPVRAPRRSRRTPASRNTASAARSRRSGRQIRQGRPALNTPHRRKSIRTSTYANCAGKRGHRRQLGRTAPVAHGADDGDVLELLRCGGGTQQQPSAAHIASTDERGGKDEPRAENRASAPGRISPTRCCRAARTARRRPPRRPAPGPSARAACGRRDCRDRSPRPQSGSTPAT